MLSMMLSDPMAAADPSTVGIPTPVEVPPQPAAPMETRDAPSSSARDSEPGASSRMHETRRQFQPETTQAYDRAVPQFQPPRTQDAEITFSVNGVIYSATWAAEALCKVSSSSLPSTRIFSHSVLCSCDLSMFEFRAFITRFMSGKLGSTTVYLAEGEHGAALRITLRLMRKPDGVVLGARATICPV